MGNSDGARRSFLLDVAGAVGASAILGACSVATAAPGEPRKRGDEEVSPVEDLMREHGVLRRVLLVYEEIARRIEAREAFPVEVLSGAADIVRRFIEDYHEKLEEDFVFPRFEKAAREVELVAVLRKQHQAGRRVTDAIRERATAASVTSTEGRDALVAAIGAFGRMYRPHSAREDTVLFPALRPLVGAADYDALGDAFEDKEHALFGARGFEGIVDEVAHLEQALGIFDLEKLTPR